MGSGLPQHVLDGGPRHRRKTVLPHFCGTSLSPGANFRQVYLISYMVFYAVRDAGKDRPGAYLKKFHLKKINTLEDV